MRPSREWYYQSESVDATIMLLLRSDTVNIMCTNTNINTNVNTLTNTNTMGLFAPYQQTAEFATGHDNVADCKYKYKPTIQQDHLH